MQTEFHLLSDKLYSSGHGQKFVKNYNGQDTKFYTPNFPVLHNVHVHVQMYMYMYICTCTCTNVHGIKSGGEGKEEVNGTFDDD